MSSLKLFLFQFVIYMNYMSSHALFEEGLISSLEAREHTFTYQVAVLGKRNLTNLKELICGAGIIARNKILSAAQCFIDEYGYHKDLTFSVIADEININLAMDDDILIDQIYLVTKETYIGNDIAVASLVDEFNFEANPDLMILGIPRELQTFKTDTGYVAGHGYYWVNDENRQIRGLGGDSDGILRYMRVVIPFGHDCVYGHGLYSTYKIICGTPLDVPQGEFWGICELDTGSPLVINRLAVGIASSNHEACDDTINGGLYTFVAPYEDFIKAIRSDSPLGSTIIYPNRPHTLE